MAEILILGGTGMLGHELWGQCAERAGTHATVRAGSPDDAGLPIIDPRHAVFGVRAEELGTVEAALDAVQPSVVVNCVGIVKQLAVTPAEMLRVNALFPHQLADLCAARRVRLVHVSTDCVFSGRRGRYSESDVPDPVDLYGRSKLAGEPAGSTTLTLRTSMIGWELGGRTQGLLEWFAAQGGSAVGGYTRALFSGPSAPALSRAILHVIDHRTELVGLLHVAAEPIAKYDLLVALRDALQLDVDVEADAAVRIDRSLDGRRFTAETGWSPPTWPEMIAELASDGNSLRRSDHVARG